MGTFNNNILPTSTGLNLGSPTQRWDVYANIIDLGSGSLLLGTGSPVSGVTPTLLSCEVGSSTDYQTTLGTNQPLFYVGVWDGTPWSSGSGYKHYAGRFDRVTKAGVDVVSGYTLGVFADAYSTNSTESSNETDQVAIVGNASSLATSSNVSVTGINAIASTVYTGALTQTVNPVQANIEVNRTAGYFGDASKAYAVGISAYNVGNFSASIGVSVDTSTVGVGWLQGVVVSGVVDSGITVCRNTITPDTGVWVNAATSFGIYVGAKQLYVSDPGRNPSYDSDHNPTVGIALGERAASSGQSNLLRFISTSSGSIEQAWDMYHSADKVLHFKYNATDMLRADDAGSLFALGDAHIKYNAGGTNYLKLTGTPTGARVKTLQDTTGTLSELGTAQTWTAQQEFDNNVKIGASGTALTQVRVYTPSLSPASVSANTTAEQTFSVSGLTTSDTVYVNKPTAQAGLALGGARVSATDTLALVFVNDTGSPIVPTAAESYRVVAIRS